MKPLFLTIVASFLFSSVGSAEERLPLIDTHIHYSHDAWDMLPPDKAVEVLQKAGLKFAFVSSSSDDGTQMLYKLAPDLVIPVLRPYRKRGESGTWFRDESVIEMMEERLARNTYAGIGEFHIFGEDANLPVMRRIVELAGEYGIFLHAHSDYEAIEYLFVQDPDARILWAHSGFEGPEKIAEMLDKYPNLTADLAFRSEHASGDAVDPEWEKLFLAYPDRIMVGTDTYTPERWFYIVEHAGWSRGWLASLPEDVRQKIAFENAEKLKNWAFKK